MQNDIKQAIDTISFSNPMKAAKMTDNSSLMLL